MRAPDPIHALYWSCANEIIGFGGKAFSKAQALNLLVCHQEQALLQSDPDARAFYDRASSELRSAIEAADRWARAARPLSPLAA